MNDEHLQRLCGNDPTLVRVVKQNLEVIARSNRDDRLARLAKEMLRGQTDPREAFTSASGLEIVSNGMHAYRQWREQTPSDQLETLEAQADSALGQLRERESK